VNIRPGEKENILVFDGDTSESLAQKFSDEHSKFYFLQFNINKKNFFKEYS